MTKRVKPIGSNHPVGEFIPPRRRLAGGDGCDPHDLLDLIYRQRTEDDHLEDFIRERDEYFRVARGRMRHGPLGRRNIQMIIETAATVSFSDGPIFEVWRVTGDVDFQISRGGQCMEQTKELLTAVNDEMQQSKKILEALVNDVKALGDVVGPALLKQATDLRNSRMTATTEIQLSLTALREIRKFFLESDYDKEMGRLERFLAACREFKALKADGTLDAVADIAIRLAVQEERPA